MRSRAFPGEMLWQYGTERAEIYVLNYSEELEVVNIPLLSELKACQVVLFCHDKDSMCLKGSVNCINSHS